MHYSNTRPFLHTNTVLCAALALSAMLFTMASLGAVPKAPDPICIGTKCTAAASQQSAGIKWHAGQYMMLRSRHRNPTAELPEIDSIGKQPTVLGVLVCFLWSDLESAPGQYDFTTIDQYFNRMKGEPLPKRLIIRIEERAFNTTTGTTVPPYLKTDPIYNGGEAIMSNGTVARIWEAPVMDRLIALYTAIGQRYDSDPYFEGISTEETSIGFSATYPAPSTYSTGALLTQFERLGGGARAAMPHSGVFMTTNYLGSNDQMEELIKYCVANQLTVGGPDTWGMAFVTVGKRQLQSDAIVRGIEGSGTDYRGIAAIKNEAEDTELGGYIAAFTPTDLFNVANTVMHANYMWWEFNNYQGGPIERWATGILPLIQSVKGKTVTTCPSSFSVCLTN